ncbi:D-amino-acid transaminase [Aureimonas flava]|uniref:Probable branched-chain-amino-acid aminotransferase n=1 Tax=Aureimonas flava TaxID=2320271 RepID=A0A3A1WJM4_9HYPH|nr:D-amino-acid transaminase [Aureimonas flava]RIY01359.1 D-amino-acid transaminase [Aureimonas flava]
MPRIVYVNGAYHPEAEAKVSVFDRGFLFADAVYEVTAVIGGRLLDFPGHCARLRRSLAELDLPSPATDDEILAIHRELVARNALDLGHVYLTVTRGEADRDFAYPKAGTAPSLVMFTQARASIETPEAERGLRIASVPDLRWGRRDIKTVQLLYPSMAKMQAKRQGKDDAWFVENGEVTEGTSNNAYIVTREGTIRTRALGHDILHGITRAALMRVAGELDLRVEEKPFTVAEAQGAREAFITSAGAFVTPVVEIDGAAIGDGRPGPIARRLRAAYLETAIARAI